MYGGLDKAHLFFKPKLFEIILLAFLLATLVQFFSLLVMSAIVLVQNQVDWAPYR